MESSTIKHAKRATHTVLAQYEGGDPWRVKFVPDELGTWTIVWSPHLTEEGYQTEPAAFDVMWHPVSGAR